MIRPTKKKCAIRNWFTIRPINSRLNSSTPPLDNVSPKIQVAKEYPTTGPVDENEMAGARLATSPFLHASTSTSPAWGGYSTIFVRVEYRYRHIADKGKRTDRSSPRLPGKNALNSCRVSAQNSIAARESSHCHSSLLLVGRMNNSPHCGCSSGSSRSCFRDGCSSTVAAGFSLRHPHRLRRRGGCRECTCRKPSAVYILPTATLVTFGLSPGLGYFATAGE